MSIYSSCDCCHPMILLEAMGMMSVTTEVMFQR